jgi:hypothetical protein
MTPLIVPAGMDIRHGESERFVAQVLAASRLTLWVAEFDAWDVTASDSVGVRSQAASAEQRPKRITAFVFRDIVPR